MSCGQFIETHLGNLAEFELNRLPLHARTAAIDALLAHRLIYDSRISKATSEEFSMLGNGMLKNDAYLAMSKSYNKQSTT